MGRFCPALPLAGRRMAGWFAVNHDIAAMNATQIISQRAIGQFSGRIFQGLLPFDKSRIPVEILAGVTLAAVSIPAVMGYTKIIGTPVLTGLYTLLLPILAFALFGSSRHLVVSADSATAAIVAAEFALLSLTANTPRYVALTSLVALVAGGMLL